MGGFILERGLARQSEMFDRRTLEEALREEKQVPRTRVTVPHSLAIPGRVRETDVLASVPASLAVALAMNSDLLRRQPPYQAGTSTIRAVWHRRDEHDEGHSWLRELVARTSRLPRRSAGLKVALKCTACAPCKDWLLRPVGPPSFRHFKSSTGEVRNEQCRRAFAPTAMAVPAASWLCLVLQTGPGVGKLWWAIRPEAPSSTARQLAEAWRKQGRPYIVDNRAGAAGRIANSQLKREQPDGSTLLCTHASALTIPACIRGSCTTPRQTCSPCRRWLPPPVPSPSATPPSQRS